MKSYVVTRRDVETGEVQTLGSFNGFRGRRNARRLAREHAQPGASILVTCAKPCADGYTLQADLVLEDGIAREPAKERRKR